MTNWKTRQLLHLCWIGRTYAELVFWVSELRIQPGCMSQECRTAFLDCLL